MSVKVFIDGSSGTTGLRIADRLAQRPEIELLSISAEGRKDVNERAKVINSADLAFLCLPDAASKEVMPLLRPDVKVLDTSTAFRTDAAWDYGFPELAGQKEKIKNSCRVAVPGCYASGFISIARPLVELGLAPAEYPFSCTGISGYSGGGKKMIADYESPDRPAHSKLDAPKSYGLSLGHKHLPEMQKISGLAHTPMFVPVVCDYYCGMQVLVPLDLTLAGTTAEAVAAALADYYKDAATVKVHGLNEPLPENGLYSNAMAGTDRMELYLTVNAAGDQMMLVSLFDNLGKGSSGAAVQCMNLMLGLEETKGFCCRRCPLRHPRKPCRKIRSSTHQSGRALRRRRCVHHQQGLRRTHQGGPRPPEGRLRTGDHREQRQRQHLRRQRRGSGRRML